MALQNLGLVTFSTSGDVAIRQGERQLNAKIVEVSQEIELNRYVPSGFVGMPEFDDVKEGLRRVEALCRQMPNVRLQMLQSLLNPLNGTARPLVKQIPSEWSSGFIGLGHPRWEG